MLPVNKTSIDPLDILEAFRGKRSLKNFRLPVLNKRQNLFRIELESMLKRLDRARLRLPRPFFF